MAKTLGIEMVLFRAYHIPYNAYGADENFFYAGNGTLQVNRMGWALRPPVTTTFDARTVPCSIKVAPVYVFVPPPVPAVQRNRRLRIVPGRVTAIWISVADALASEVGADNEATKFVGAMLATGQWLKPGVWNMDRIRCGCPLRGAPRCTAISALPNQYSRSVSSPARCRCHMASPPGSNGPRPGTVRRGSP